MSRFGKCWKELEEESEGERRQDIRSMEDKVNKDRNLTKQRILKKIPFPVTIAKGFHLFPSRTQKLSPSASMVLGWRRPGRVDRRRIPITLVTMASVFSVGKALQNEN